MSSVVRDSGAKARVESRNARASTLADRSPHYRVSTQMLALILVVAIPLAVVAGLTWWRAALDSRAVGLGYLRATAGQVSRELEQLHRQSEWLLSSLARRPDIRALNPTACDAEMALMREVHPAFLGITVWRPDGTLVCHSLPQPVASGPPLPHRPSLEAGLAAPGLYVSDLFRGKITGRLLATVTYPIREESRTVGPLSLPIGPEYFERLLAEVLDDTDSPRGMALGILDREGRYVARVPDGDRWRGELGRGSPSVDAALAAGSGAAEVEGSDGRLRIYVFKRVPDVDWRVLVGVPAEELLAGQRRNLVLGATAAVLILAATLTLGYAFARRFVRPLESLAAIADRVAAGDIEARAPVSGSAEVVRVAGLFNRMLDALRTTELALKDSYVRLRELSSRVMRAEESERRRIARDLHDQVGQALTALELELHGLRRSGAADGQRLERCLQISGQLLEDVRDLSLDLRPAQLDDLGLAAALRWHLDRYLRPRGIEVHFEADVRTERLTPEIETACFRIAQEALTNVLRHSRARRVDVELREQNDELVMTVRNDGAPFDPNAASAKESSGLRTMGDRAVLAGGRFEIKPRPGGGAEVEARFPLSEERV